MRLYLKNKASRTGGMGQVVENLLSKLNTLTSNPNSTKKKKKKCKAS
jgi:hypothetical protein